MSGKLPADVTEGEERMLATILRELRHAAAMGLQVSIIFDPWVIDAQGSRKVVGANLGIHHNGSGYGTEVLGVRKQKTRRPGARSSNPAMKR